MTSIPRTLTAFALVGFAFAAAAQDAHPGVIKLPAANPVEARLADLEHRLAAVESENAALKEQLSQTRTSVKAIDMTLTDLRKRYDGHTHFVSNVTIAGTVGVVLPDAKVPTILMKAVDTPMHTGKPLEQH